MNGKNSNKENKNENTERKDDEVFCGATGQNKKGIEEKWAGSPITGSSKETATGIEEDSAVRIETDEVGKETEENYLRNWLRQYHDSDEENATK